MIEAMFPDAEHYQNDHRPGWRSTVIIEETWTLIEFGAYQSAEARNHRNHEMQEL